MKIHAFGTLGIPGRRAHDPEPLRAADSALCVRAQRPAVRPQHAAAALRHGPDVRRDRDTRGRRRRLGRAAEFGRSHRRARRARRIRRHAAVAARGGCVLPSFRRAREPHRHRRRQQRRPCGNAVCPSRRCDGISLGTLCRPDPRIDPDGRCTRRPERANHDPAVCLRAGSDRLAGACCPRRRPRVRSAEADTRRGRMGPPRPRRCRARGGGCHCARLGHRRADAPLVQQHEPYRADAHRRLPGRHDGRAGSTFHDDDGLHRRRVGAAGRRPLAAARRRGFLAQLAAAHARGPARQGRADRFLDVLLHQLPARDALRQGLARPSTKTTAWS